uniref:Death domain-containing protein n=1 Tax=Branchiostoma floridae TaxID=7739 RepID=C3ZC35_BRAFL|eukprot:XP_002593796.1 hypothetical protein BRAFLDRAFT_75745 [Branchiostoma floridae]
MHTIGPALNCVDLGGELTQDRFDHIRNKLTPIQRVLEMMKLVEDKYLLGSAVEICFPEFADLFWRKKRGKGILILHTDDYTAEFVSPLQTTLNEAGLSCHTETITATDSITEKTVELLLNPSNRMVLLVISPQALHHNHWSNLDYEFPVRNDKLLLPILLYPRGSRDRMVRFLQQRAPVMCNLTSVEIRDERKDGARRKTEGNHAEDFHQMLESIFSRLDDRDMRLLLRLWSARTGKQESTEIETPADLMKTMLRTGYITTGNLGMLEKDMIAAGISLPIIMRDIPGVPEEMKYTRTIEAAVGPAGGELEIPGFVKLIVPQGVLQQDTMITISTVDVAAILRDPESVNWISGYPWSLGEDDCPRELLDQVLFSPAVDVNLHGAQLNGPVEVQTWRPPGSEGMKCLLLKHHDAEGWTDITALTRHHIDSDRLSMLLQTFSLQTILFAPVKAVAKVTNAMLGVFSSETVEGTFTAYVNPGVNEMEFHLVCRDQSVETDEYHQGFKWCGSNEARSPLYNGDVIKVNVSLHECETSVEETLCAKLCKRRGQKIQMRLKRPETRHPTIGEACVFKFQHPQWLNVCNLTFREEGLVDISTTDVKIYFDKVIARASSNWDNLALQLGFDMNEIKGIETLKPDQDRRCREMLHRWRNREGSDATLQVLKQALIDIGEKRTAESLEENRMQTPTMCTWALAPAYRIIDLARQYSCADKK